MSKKPIEIIDTSTGTPDNSKKPLDLTQKCGAYLVLQYLDKLNTTGKSMEITPKDREPELSGDCIHESTEES